MPVLETPSRVWRRIQAADDLALPSLPSLPAIDDDDLEEEDETDPQPIHSRPTPSLVASTKKSTTVRFAETHESFEFSDILPITHQSILTDDDGDKPQVDYSIDLKSHISPPAVDLNTSVGALRRARTPSLTRSASLASTSSNSTPTSDAHVSLINTSRRSSTSTRQQQSTIHEEPSRDSAEQQRTRQSFSTSRISSILDTTQTPRKNQLESLTQQTTPRQLKPQPTDASIKDDGNATPHAKKRSFLLDVIQSTAKPRPRLSMHTPMQARPSFNVPASAAALISTPKPGVNESFISTASSHDLTVHRPNINASFDHLTGAKGVGRFDATKLNTYLHGLNRRLVEENEALMRQLKVQQPSVIMESDESMKSMEIAALEEKVKDLEVALEKEIAQKESEKVAFKERLQEVEEGVNEIVEKLEQDLEAAGQAKEQALIKVRRAQELKEDAEDRARRAEVALAKLSKESTSLRRSAVGSPTGSGSGTASSEHEEFKEAIERVAQLEAELRISNDRYQTLEEDLKGTEEELRELRTEKRTDDKKMASMKKQVEEITAEADGLDARVKELEEELAESKQNTEQLLAELEQVQEETEVVKEEADGAKADVEVLQERVDILESRCSRFENEARQMEEALEAGESKAMHDQEEMESLRHEVEKLRPLAASTAISSVRASTNTAVSAHLSSPLTNTGITSITEEIESLEKELDDAYREIGRLQHLLQDSPTREALTQAKDTRIEILEKENADLEERIRTLRVLINKGSMPGNGSLALLGTPLGRAKSFAGMASPAGHNMPSLLGPKTPGGPLRDLSWLQNTDTPDEMQYLRQISLLERELAHANENVDDKIDKLNEYGVGVLGLTDKLSDAQARIAFLDGEVKRLERREERRLRRLKKGVNCNGCGGTVHLTSGLSMEDQSSLDASTPYAGDVTTNESMKKVLEQLDKMKQDWAHEKMRLEGEREYLQGAADRLNREMDRAKKEQDAMDEGAVSELDQARRAIGELEGQLQAERARLKTITAERNRMINEKTDIASNLGRTQADMEAIKEQLHKCKQENYALEADLRSNTIAESKSRHLQSKVAENQALIDQLRHERDQLSESHSALQQRYTLASERVERLRTDLRTTQSHHDERRHQLDLQIAEIEDLRREIAWRDEELALERRRGAAGSELVATVNALEKEVDRVRADAEMFARELKTLRDGREDLELLRREEASRAERVQMQLKAQVRVLDEQADEQRGRIRRLVEELETHICIPGDDAALAKLKAQHNNECKGLMVQIHYLKLKYTRENDFRRELAYQKQYLLVLLSRYHPSPQPILAVIAQETPRTDSGASRPRRSIRSVAHTIMFLSRMKKAAAFWSAQNETREQLVLALEDVRRRRGGRKSAPGIY